MCLMMDFRFGLITIFLILDVVHARSVDNGAIRKYSKVQFSQDSSQNPFQAPINGYEAVPGLTQDNPFVLNNNSNNNPYAPNVFLSQVLNNSNVYNKNPPLNSKNNTKIEIQFPRPTQKPCTQPRYHNTLHMPLDLSSISNISRYVLQNPFMPCYHATTSILSTFYMPFSTTASVANDFTTSRIPISPETVRPITHAPSKSENPLHNVNCQTNNSERTGSASNCEGYVNDITNTTSTTSLTNSSSGVTTEIPFFFAPTQRPNTTSSQPHYQTSTVNPPVSYIPIFNRPPDNDFTTFRTTIPPKTPLNSSLSPMGNLLPTNISPMSAISERKCEEYEKEIANKIISLTGLSSNVNNSCFNTNHLVVGNNQAQQGEFPHMVAVGRRNYNLEFILMCGGTLISHTWVLTAAHCTHKDNDFPTEARLGIYRLTNQGGVTTAIKKIIRHPDYDPPALYADIALLQLTNAVTFDTSIRPACLYQNYDTVPTQAWVSGWDITEYNGQNRDQLQKAQLNMVDNLFCTTRYNSSTKVPYGVTTSMICAGDPRGNWTKDGCQGDSGGPLQTVHPKRECLFQVIGILSFNQGCELIDIPGVYTRVSHYLSWIEETVWPQG